MPTTLAATAPRALALTPEQRAERAAWVAERAAEAAADDARADALADALRAAGINPDTGTSNAPTPPQSDRQPRAWHPTPDDRRETFWRPWVAAAHRTARAAAWTPPTRTGQPGPRAVR